MCCDSSVRPSFDALCCILLLLYSVPFLPHAIQNNYHARAFKAIRRAEVVVLMLDATTGLVDQDRILAQRIEEEGRACVIALNKWDLVPQKDDKTYLKAIENIQSNLPALRWADVSMSVVIRTSQCCCMQ